jgi:hypothetical protein
MWNFFFKYSGRMLTNDGEHTCNTQFVSVAVSDTPSCQAK